MDWVIWLSVGGLSAAVLLTSGLVIRRVWNQLQDSMRQ